MSGIGPLNSFKFSSKYGVKPISACDVTAPGMKVIPPSVTTCACPDDFPEGVVFLMRGWVMDLSCSWLLVEDSRACSLKYIAASST